MNKFADMIGARFNQRMDGMVVAHVAFYHDSGELVVAKLIDFDHQSLIDTLNAIWPTWTDHEQNEARTA